MIRQCPPRWQGGRMSMKPRGLRLALTIAAACVGFTSSSSAESLKSVVEKTLTSNPEIGALIANRLAIDQELEAAKGLGRPTLDVRGSAGYVWTDQQKGTSPTGFEDDTAEYNISAVASMPIFDGWKTSYEVENNANRVDSARHRVADTANSLGLQAIQVYLEVQRAGAVLEIAERNVRVHRTYLSRVNTRIAGGAAAEAEGLQARSRLADSEAALIEARSRLTDAWSAYIAVVGEQPGSLSPAGRPGHMPKSAGEAVEIALQFAPSLIALHHDAEAARAAIGSAESEFYPKLNLEVSADHKGDQDKDFTDESNFKALVVGKLNIYNGGIDTARVREARFRASQAEQTALNARRQIEKEVRLSWLAIMSANARAQVLRHQLEQNKALVGAYLKQFDLGQRSLMDILDVQNEIFTTETTIASENFSGTFNSYRVLAAMGRLLDALNLPLPDEATREPDRYRRIAIP